VYYMLSHGSQVRDMRQSADGGTHITNEEWTTGTPSHAHAYIT